MDEERALANRESLASSSLKAQNAVFADSATHGDALMHSAENLKAAQERVARGSERKHKAALTLDSLERSGALGKEAQRAEGAREAQRTAREGEEARQAAIGELEAQRVELARQLEASGGALAVPALRTDT